VSGPEEIAASFSLAAAKRAEALIVMASPALNFHSRRIVDLATQAYVPAIYPTSFYVTAGGLMSYGAEVTDLFRRSAEYVDKILKGAKPSDLPVQQPTTFEFVINLRTAAALGITVPESLLIQAGSVLH
jgi:putative tryptophan/tyrosine transport system substrate-binding protein